MRAAVEGARRNAGRRAIGIFATLLIEFALLLLVFTLGEGQPAKSPRPLVVSMSTHDVPEEAQPAPRPSPPAVPHAQAAQEPAPVPEPRAQTAPVPIPRPPALTPAPLPIIELPHDQLALAKSSPSKAPAAGGGAAYGPADTGGGDPDTPRVGTAPNGQPLYAAKWYREPTHDELAGYLSTASGPGWALVACKTVPDWRVEDCVGLDEFPQGSQMIRAVLASSWQFRVRPPRRSGEYQVGAWVRILIDYDIKRRG